jgi:hypothetical protein
LQPRIGLQGFFLYGNEKKAGTIADQTNDCQKGKNLIKNKRNTKEIEKST